LVPPFFVGIVLLLLFLLKKEVSRNICALTSFGALTISTLLLLMASNNVLSKGTPVYEAYPLYALVMYGQFDLFADWLSLPLALAITFLSALSALYSASYMESLEVVRVETEMADYSVAYQKALESPEYVPTRKPGAVPSMAAYFGNLLLFAGSMLGVVLSRNLIQFFIFFELAIVPTFFLVYVWGSGPCKLIAIKYFVYMFVGGTLLILGIAWIYAAVKTLDILALPRLLYALDGRDSLVIAVLLFVGFGMKAAIIPFHTWLPDFHAEAPVPIHALLSAVLIKCGIYGIVRLVFVGFPSLVGGLGGTDARSFLLVLSLATMVWGAMMALTQIQIKRILAYSSVNQVGYIMLGLVSGTQIGITGGLFHIITHGIAKGLLLLCAGSIIHQSHVRDVDKLGGLAKNMPLTASVTLLGGLSIAGTPPLAGFASEWMIFLGVMQAGYFHFALIGLISTSLTVGYYLWTVRRIFFNQRLEGLEDVREPSYTMLVPMCIEATLLVLLGIYPQFALQLISPGAEFLYKILGGT